MRNSILFLTLPLVALSISCAKELSPSSTSTLPRETRQESCFIEGAAQIYVTEAMAEKIEKNAPDMLALESDYGVISLERIFPDAGRWEARHREAGLHRWYRVNYDEHLKDQTKALSNPLSIEGVEKFEKVRRIKMLALKDEGIPFNDPDAKKYQWQYYNTGTAFDGYKAGADINVTQVWREFTGGIKDVIVAVVDDGVPADHVEFSGVLMPAQAGGSRNFVTNTYKIVAGDHGANVAGVVGAINNNGKGGCGTAGGLDGTGGVTLMSCQIFQEDSEGKTHQGNSADAIVWGADHGALISQNSWGYVYDSEEDARRGRTDGATQDAIDYFIKNAGCDENGQQVGLMKGGIVTFAAGNDSFAYAYPAGYAPVIAVGAIGPDGLRASYSNYGDWVDICAPGGEDTRFKRTAAKDGSSYIFGPFATSYGFMCGTSQACPHVSGVAALLISVHGGPGFTNTKLEEMLINGANYDIVPASEKIGPLLDAYNSMIYGNEPPEIALQHADIVLPKAGATFTIDCDKLFTDPDGDALTYTLEAESDGVMEFSQAGANITLKAKGIGTGKVTITARDPKKAVCSQEIRVGVFDDSQGPAIYPNPVSEMFYVRIGEAAETSVKIYNATGALLYDHKYNISLFEPKPIVISDYAPGKYTVCTEYRGESHSNVIVKK